MKTVIFCWLGVALALLAQDDPASWKTYGRTLWVGATASWIRSNTKTVAGLVPQWMYQTGVPGKNETTPLVFDGMMYITGPNNTAWALDALTGRSIWSYKSPQPAGLNLCCGPVNRGFDVHGNKLFKVNLEGTLVAMDAKSAVVLWRAVLEDWRKGYTATAAPLIVKNLVITGMAGAEFGTRGFIDAYDMETGKRVWRFYTVPAADEPGGSSWTGDAWKRGGGATWITGTYDPQSNVVFWGTGNPGPDMDGGVLPGDNLYTCSLVAIDADTGKLKWHYQFTPHDVHDWDAVSDPVLIDLALNGRTVKAVMQAHRNGYFYALDRINGKVLHARASPPCGPVKRCCRVRG